MADLFLIIAVVSAALLGRALGYQQGRMFELNKQLKDLNDEKAELLNSIEECP